MGERGPMWCSAGKHEADESDFLALRPGRGNWKVKYCNVCVGKRMATYRKQIAAVRDVKKMAEDARE